MKIVRNIAFITLIGVVVFIAASLISNTLFGVTVPESGESDQKGILMMCLATLFNTVVVYWYVKNSFGARKWILARVFIAIFGIQFFLTQIETLWFNDAVQMPLTVIYAVLFSGALYSAIMAFVFSRFASGSIARVDHTIDIWKMLLAGAFVYPFIYHAAGYFIAWQFSALRSYYNGPLVPDGYFHNVFSYISSSLYLFQLIRGAFWAYLGYLVLGSLILRAKSTPWIMGGLFAVLMTSLLLLNNPYMPVQVRYIHLLEVFLSNFLWGALIVVIARRFEKRAKQDYQKSMSSKEGISTPIPGGKYPTLSDRSI